MIAAADPPWLTVEAKIPLGEVRGRLDHLALDVPRQRLYVAELGNDSLGVVDLRERRVLRTVTGLHEPQGVAYVSSTDTVWVANGGDGTLRLFRGDSGQSEGSLPLGEDPDNIRLDAKAKRVFVGYGNGGIAIIDALSRKSLGTIALKGHPEGFQLDADSKRAYVNVPDARQIAVLDLGSERQSATWAITRSTAANFPLALDPDNHRLFAGFRSPPTLVVHDLRSGQSLTQIPICGDTDDIAWVARRHLAYVACGDGFIDVIDLGGDRAQRMARMQTAKGARTLLYSPELDRVYVAVRAAEQAPAAIWVLRPVP